MNTPEEQLSDSLLAACKAAGIEKPKNIAQDDDGQVWHYESEPRKRLSLSVWDSSEGKILNHPPYADDWQDSLLEWIEPQGEPLADVLVRHPDHIADDSKKVDSADDACKIAYRNRLNDDTMPSSNANIYQQAWSDALAWAQAEKGGYK